VKSDGDHHTDAFAEPGEPDVPEAPWLRALRKPRERAPLSRDAIVDAALRVLDRDGAGAFSMRRLAEELGVGAGAIYWHVENKEQLLQLVFDRVIGNLPMPTPDPERWREQVRQAALEEREMLKRPPGIAQLMFGRIPLGPNSVRYIEWHLSLLRVGGLSERVIALAGDLVFLYIAAFAYEEYLRTSASTDELAPGHDFVGELREYFASLPPDRFPNVVSLAVPLTSGGPDERFAFGIDVLIDGLVAQSQRER
jgi:AcrR family transcriptional regulator